MLALYKKGTGMAVQLATRVDDEQARRFRAYTAELGTTPSDALRIFIAAFNRNKGFPYEIKLEEETHCAPFENEEEAMEFSAKMANEMIEHAW